MPETRKHRVTPRDELDEALFAAFGEPVQPLAPGSRPAPETFVSEADAPVEDSADDPAPVSPVMPIVGRGTVLGGFTFGGPSS